MYDIDPLVPDAHCSKSREANQPIFKAKGTVEKLCRVQNGNYPISALGGKNKNPQFNFKSTSNRWICKENGLSWRSI